MLELKRASVRCVKHLNPRQGITIFQRVALKHILVRILYISVKHLNPRQGITMRVVSEIGGAARANQVV